MFNLEMQLKKRKEFEDCDEENLKKLKIEFVDILIDLLGYEINDMKENYLGDEILFGVGLEEVIEFDKVQVEWIQSKCFLGIVFFSWF